MSNTYKYFLVLFIATFAYWMYHAYSVMIALGSYIRQIIGSQEPSTYSEMILLGGEIVTLRGNILYYGFYFFHFLFAGILIISLIKFKHTKKIQDIVFISFLFFCMLYSFLSLYISGLIISPQRLLTFAWMLGLPPLVYYVIHINNSIVKNALCASLVLFMVFNIYNIDPAFINSAPHLSGLVADDKEYSIAKTIKIPENVEYYGHIGALSAIFDIQGGESYPKRPLSKIDVFCDSFKLIIIYEELIGQDGWAWNNTINDSCFNKIYDIGNDYYVFSGGG